MFTEGYEVTSYVKPSRISKDLESKLKVIKQRAIFFEL